MFGKRKINKKLDLLLQRQCMLMELFTSVYCDYRQKEKVAKIWNNLWYKIMEGKDDSRS